VIHAEYPVYPEGMPPHRPLRSRERQVAVKGDGCQRRQDSSADGKRFKDNKEMEPVAPTGVRVHADERPADGGSGPPPVALPAAHLCRYAEIGPHTDRAGQSDGGKRSGTGRGGCHQ
jgi:hypothetical protein